MKFRHLAMLAVLLFTSSLLFADGGRRDRIGFGGGGRPGDHIGFPEPTLPGYDTTVELQVNRYFQEREQLDLLADYYIVSQLRGKLIKDITIFAATERGMGEAQLLLNGQQLERGQIVAQRVNAYTFRVDPFANEVERSLRSAVLNLRGKFYIEKVVFNLLERDNRHDPFPMPPIPTTQIIRQQMNERILGEGGLDLFRIFNLSATSRGQTIKSVTVSGRSVRGIGLSELLVNGQSTGVRQQIKEGPNSVTFNLGFGSRVGENLQALQIHLMGLMVIEEISMEVESLNTPQWPDVGRPLDRRH